MTQEGIDAGKTVADIAAATTTIGVILGWLPTIATALAIAWYLVRFYEWAEKRFFGRDGGPTTRD